MLENNLFSPPRREARGLQSRRPYIKYEAESAERDWV